MVKLKTKTKKTIASSVLIIVMLAVSILLNNISSRALPSIYSKICIFIIAALALNIICGNLGELVLGHGGFMLIGYSVAYVLTNVLFEAIGKSFFQESLYNAREGLQALGYLYIIGIALLAGIVTGLIGWIVGVIVMGRLKGDYLAIVTLGIGLIFVCVVQNIPAIGTQPLSITSKMTGNTILYTVIMITVILAAIMFITSRFGRGIISIREDAIAAESSGIPVNKYKIMAFTIASVIVGIAGALYSFESSQTANEFNTDLSIELLLMVVLGGLGSYTGTIVAVPILLIFNEYILVKLPPEFSNNPKIFYGVLLVVVMLFRNEGLLGTKEFSWEWGYKTFVKVKNWFIKLFKKKPKTPKNPEVTDGK